MQDTNKKSGKKLFGIFNAIDIVFILIVIAAIGIFVWKTGINTTESKEYVIGFYSEEVSDFVVNNLKIGSSVAGDSDFDDLGKIIDIDIRESISYAFNDEGKIVTTVGKYGYKSVVIYSKVKGNADKYGLSINGHTYAPGHSFTLYAENAKIYLRVFSLQEIKKYDADGKPVFDKPEQFIDLEDMKFAVDTQVAPKLSKTETDITETEETVTAG